MPYKKGDLIYILFDGRYHADPDRATVYTVCGNLGEAQETKKNDFTDAVIVENVFINSAQCEATGKTW